MPDRRTIQTIRLKHESHCHSCPKTLQPDQLVYWSQGGYTWCLSCPVPDMPPFDPTPEQTAASIDAWMDRKVAEEDARQEARRAFKAAHTPPSPPPKNLQTDKPQPYSIQSNDKDYGF